VRLLEDKELVTTDNPIELSKTVPLIVNKS
jgi:hypothetical protein